MGNFFHDLTYYLVFGQPAVPNLFTIIVLDKGTEIA